MSSINLNSVSCANTDVAVPTKLFGKYTGGNAATPASTSTPVFPTNFVTTATNLTSADITFTSGGAIFKARFPGVYSVTAVCCVDNNGSYTYGITSSNGGNNGNQPYFSTISQVNWNTYSTTGYMAANETWTIAMTANNTTKCGCLMISQISRSA